MSARMRFPLLGLWLSVLLWPYLTVGALQAPWALAPLPLVFGAVHQAPRRLARIVDGAAVITAVGFNLPGLSWPLTLPDFLLRPWLSPFVMALATVVGWLLFRDADNRERITLLGVLGIGLLVGDQVLFHLRIGSVLFAYLVVGFGVMATVRWEEWGRILRGPVPPLWYALAALTAALPVTLAWLGPAWPGHPWPPGPTGAGSPTGAGNAYTGLSIGATNINHPVNPSAIPVLTVTHIPGPAYWEAATYAFFNGTTWSLLPSPVRLLPPGASGPLLGPWFTGWPIAVWHPHIQVSDPLLASQILYTGRPTGVSHAGLLTVLTRSDQIWATRPFDYDETVRVARVDPRALASVPFTAPPAWLAPDLTVPNSLAKRLRWVAERATAGADGPWQAAVDLKRYLDTHERYSLDFRPSPTRNPVLQFLFVTHAGYCDQFSTAFVLLSRLLDIPARWVVGYAPGTYDPTTGAWVIRAEDAHSWAQIWVRGYGWVAVDPTPGWPLLAMPSRGRPALSTNRPRLPARFPLGGPTPFRQSTPRSPGSRVAFPLATGLVLLGAGAAFAGRRRRRTSLLAATAREWERLTRRYGVPHDPRLSLRDQWRRLPDDVRPLVAPAVLVLEQWRYGPEPPSPAMLAQSVECLRQARKAQRPRSGRGESSSA